MTLYPRALPAAEDGSTSTGLYRGSTGALPRLTCGSLPGRAFRGGNSLALVSGAGGGHLPWRALALLAVIGAVVYVLACVFEPNVACRRCGGRGYVSGVFGGLTGGRRNTHICPRCHNAKQHVRFGARVMNIGRGRADRR